MALNLQPDFWFQKKANLKAEKLEKMQKQYFI